MPGDEGKTGIQDLIDFWFAESSKARWYDSTAEFDQSCFDRFGKLVQLAKAGDLDQWAETPLGALALCLLLDQMPRNIYRASPKAFESDQKAILVAKDAIERGFDQELDLEKRKFLYLPFMHSEVLAEQERSVSIATTLGDEETVRHAIEHAEVIRRFGRFPHRNAILGRVSTEEEIAYLEAGAETYGQSSRGEG